MAKFEQTNLSEVDPGQQTIPERDFNFRVLSAKLGAYTSASGEEGEYISTAFGIVDDPEYTGRQVYHTYFPDKEGKSGTAKQLRILMDATGVQAEPFTCGEDFVSYLNSVRDSGATFSAPVEIKQETRKGSTDVVPTPRIKAWKVVPAR